MQGFAARSAPRCARSRSCVREGNWRGPGQMFPFTNAAKEPGMPSSLPWRYLHFTTSSNNHATSSLGKENTTRQGSVTPSPPLKGRKLNLFFFIQVLKLCLVSLCPLPSEQDTSIPSPIHFEIITSIHNCFWGIRDG